MERDSLAQLVCAELLPPLLLSNEHLFCLDYVELASSQEPQESCIVVSFCDKPFAVLLGLELLLELVEGMLLGDREVTDAT